MEKRKKYENSYIKTNKGVYIGRIENKKKNGWGIAINNNGNKYEGLFLNDEKHLFGSELLCCLYSHNYKYKKGKKSSEEENSEEEFEKGNICLHENRYIYIGNFKRGEKYGNGILIDYNTYAMYNCIFLKNEIIYKDILFSLFNNMHPEYEKWNSTCNYYDKKNYTKEGEYNFSNFNKKNEQEYMNYNQWNENKKKENDIYLFIENHYRYNIFNYSNFFRHTMEKIKKDDFTESFYDSKYRNKVYFGNIKKKKKKKKLHEVPSNDINEKKKNNKNIYDKTSNFINYEDKKKSCESTSDILKDKKEIENNYYEKNDINYFVDEPFQKYIDDISLSKRNGYKEEKQIDDHINNEKKDTDNYHTGEKNDNIIKENSNNYEDSMNIKKNINNSYDSFKRVNIDDTFANSINTEMSKNVSISKLKNPSNDIKIFLLQNEEDKICKTGDKKKEKRGFLSDKIIDKKLNNDEKYNMKEVRYLIKDELENKFLSKENIKEPNVLSNIKCGNGLSDHHFSKKNIEKNKIDNLYEHNDKIVSFENRINCVDSDNDEVNNKSDILDKKNFKSMHNNIDNDSTSSSSSSSTSNYNEMKNNITRINSGHMTNSNSNIKNGGSYSSSRSISSCDSISDNEKIFLNNAKKEEKNNDNYNDNINTSINNNIIFSDSNSLFKINQNKGIKEKKENDIYKKCNISEDNISLRLKNEQNLHKELHYMLPRFLRKEKKERHLSCAQNCIYWSVFELNFFLFFIGIPKKVLEIFIINHIDGYCLKYLEKKLLKKMGIHDKIIRKYILLAVQYLLRLREKYKYKKRSKKLNAKIDSNFTLKKKKIHFLNLIGRGGYSNVYRCFYGDNILSNNDCFYIKYLINNIALKIFINKKYTSEFFSELQILSTLRHPNVSLFLGGIKNPRGIALEYIRCGSIFDILHKHKMKIKIYDIIKMCKDITAFMCFLHYKGILHCDLKSSNILLSLSGEIKICDFGLSVQNPYQKPKYLGIVGTYQWTAPEVLRGEGYTQQADIYSFGVILWELLHRKIPFNNLKHPLDIIANVGYGNKELVINKSIPEKIRYILKRCLHRSKHKRKSFFFWSEYFDLLHKTQAIDIEENLNLFFG
ncbi:tyrosine kinase-like protein, putative [Plasmodium gallinaceum]|uniref:Tyrosine kinase-like protein, putative n=1 Tax=Plasmodium gallinaceum TaxID=5849 RepID=A0A1J1GSN4_PLAGA|nr:tyrosine kinase-like protein, putative [Plasmodium gallinaceum]CRG94320.1 tyrosine kinase-like protein, putative [Plasmodium gallinaceum]